MTKYGHLFLIGQLLLYKRFGFGSIFIPSWNSQKNLWKPFWGSGGTLGTDSIAEQCTKELGMNVVLKIPPGHPRSKTITPLSELVLSQAVTIIYRAANILGRSIAFTNSYKGNLLRRNLFILSKAKAVYAFGLFEDPHDPHTLRGGTG